MVNPTLDLEKELWKKGYVNICGIDEVGRGPLAGPVVVGAVIVNNEEQFLEGVRDSKTMTEKKRDYFFDKIKDICPWGIGIVDSVEIDDLGLTQAIQKAIRLALKDLKTSPDYILLDGGIPLLEDYEMEGIDKGDLLHYSISSASVLAKVTRDRIMREFAIKYPNYFFERHVGYGTKLHMEALEKFGPCEIHRRSFKPIAKFFK